MLQNGNTARREASARVTQEALRQHRHAAMPPPAEPSPELPVHVAAAAGVSGEELAALLAANPQACGTEDAHGLLPLHHACAHGRAASACVAALLAAHPPGVRTRAVGGLLPLHLACECRSEHAVALVALLLEAAPETAGSPDRRGRLPLHVAAGSGVSTGVARALLAADRKAATAIDAAGATPAHYAAAAPESAETLVLLLEVNPQARVRRSSRVSGACVSNPIHVTKR